MTFIRFAPNNYENTINRMFMGYPFQQRSEAAFQPGIDIYENKDKIYIEVEVPGVKKEDIKILVKENILTISGEKKNINDGSRKYYKTGRLYGEFKKSFTLPVEIDSAYCSARFEDGLLTVEFEKAREEQVKERTIEVK